MDNDTEPDWRLLSTYLSGEATPDDLLALERWLKDHPERESLLQALRRSWELPTRTFSPPFDLTAIERKVLPRVAAAPAISVRQIRTLRRVAQVSRSKKTAWSVAAASVAAASVGIAAALAVIVGTRPHHAPDAWTGAMYTTATGQRATVRLPDGTRVTLAPHASLRLNKNFDADTRKVALSGQAYFEIASKSAHPFIVQAGAVETQVLGTSFAVRRCDTGQTTNVQVAVTSGRVVVRGVPRAGRPQSMVLSSGMVGVVTDSSLLATSVTNVADYTAWVNGELVFREAPVPQVLATLERWYGFHFRVSDSTLAKQQLTARFSNGPASDMLKALARLLDVTLTFDDSVVTLRPRSSARGTQRGPRPTKQESIVHPRTEVGR